MCKYRKENTNTHTHWKRREVKRRLTSGNYRFSHLVYQRFRPVKPLVSSESYKQVQIYEKQIENTGTPKLQTCHALVLMWEMQVRIQMALCPDLIFWFLTSEHICTPIPWLITTKISSWHQINNSTMAEYYLYKIL